LFAISLGDRNRDLANRGYGSNSGFLGHDGKPV
jgi:hypothetical protein